MGALSQSVPLVPQSVMLSLNAIVRPKSAASSQMIVLGESSEPGANAVVLLVVMVLCSELTGNELLETR